jgi:hypothetical protein
MAQITVTKDSLRAYTRSLETRLYNKAKYSDTWIDETINTGFAITTEKRQPFYQQEVLDLAQYITDDTSKFEVEMSEDVIGWRNIYYSRDNTVEFTDAATYRLMEDNKVIIDIIPSQLISKSNTFTFEYYFAPKVTSVTDMFMSSDIYQLLKYGIGIAAYQNLHDEKSEATMLQRFEMAAKQAVNGLDIYANGVVKANWDMPARNY